MADVPLPYLTVTAVKQNIGQQQKQTNGKPLGRIK
jgi:hypothetical protein